MNEIAVVFTHQMVEVDGFAEVAQVLNTPFQGPQALRRAKQFRESEEAAGDFPESEGWSWHIWSNQAAREVESERLLDQILGPKAAK